PLIAVGLGLLALEFRWAEAALARALRHAERVRPSSGRQRVAAGAALVGSAGVAAAGIALWGVPGSRRGRRRPAPRAPGARRRARNGSTLPEELGPSRAALASASPRG